MTVKQNEDKDDHQMSSSIGVHGSSNSSILVPLWCTYQRNIVGKCGEQVSVFKSEQFHPSQMQVEMVFF